MRKSFFSFLLPAILALAAPLAFAAGSGKIGVIDAQSILEQSAAGKEVQVQMKAYYDKQHQWAQDQQAKLQKEQDDIQKNQNVISADALKKQQDQFQQDYQAYQQEYQKRQQQFQQYQQSRLQPLQASLYDVVQNYAKQNGYDLVLDKGAVVYNQDALDITDAVLKAFNAAQPHAPAPATSSH